MAWTDAVLVLSEELVLPHRRERMGEQVATDGTMSYSNRYAECQAPVHPLATPIGILIGRHVVMGSPAHLKGVNACAAH